MNHTPPPTTAGAVEAPSRPGLKSPQTQKSQVLGAGSASPGPAQRNAKSQAEPRLVPGWGPGQGQGAGAPS